MILGKLLRSCHNISSNLREAIIFEGIRRALGFLGFV